MSSVFCSSFDILGVNVSNFHGSPYDVGEGSGTLEASRQRWDHPQSDEGGFSSEARRARAALVLTTKLREYRVVSEV